jgi:predicted RNase H-like HicB family nuclease
LQTPRIGEYNSDAMRATLEFTLPARIRKKGRWYISSCGVLDVHSQGRTRREAEQNLKDALASFLLSCFERGTLEDVFREAGFEPVKPRADRAKRSLRPSNAVSVPLPFRIDAHLPSRAA